MKTFRNMFFVAVATAVLGADAAQTPFISDARKDRMQNLKGNSAFVVGGLLATGYALNKTTDKARKIGDGLTEAGAAGVVQVALGGSDKAVGITVGVDGVLQAVDQGIRGTEVDKMINKVPGAYQEKNENSYGRWAWRTVVSNACGFGYDVKNSK